MVREPNMTRLIQSLQASDLISRQIDRSDRRAFHLYLTAEGERLMSSVAERIDALEEMLLGGLSPVERNALRGLLNRVLENIDP